MDAEFDGALRSQIFIVKILLILFALYITQSHFDILGNEHPIKKLMSY